ncbi:ROK family transcriptional regulator [Dactylosporangium vinaceum]|uniref:ROK family protein n=1 Tax=Dactylosporangium vinaceum TaxID=53362 RepID=A0ABV5MB56_9ACTN|nr:ROK family transcriptional regulator [Dactylosporangium vinaceum]UAB98338.1 ROK family transcriptional regulator [Dactylosporangium vinaceum]
MRTEEPRRGADHNVMREVNRSLVLALVKEGGPVSRASIARSTTLAKPTVSAIVDELIAEGLVREIGPGSTAVSGGRPPILLEFNARSLLVVGVHIGARRTTIAIGDATGEEVARRELPTPKDQTPAVVLAQVAAEAKDAIAGAGLPGAKIAAVGAVLPGLTDFHTGICLLAPNLGWRDVPVRDLLAAALDDAPVYVHNAGQAAAVAENLEGAGERVGDLALLYTGTGLSAGVLSDGRVFHGVGGTAGEIGHNAVPGNTEPCNCGKVGCLETVASGPAIVRAARRAGLDGYDARDVTAAARAGDPVARQVIAEVGEHLGLAASWLINAYNPALVVVGGGLAAIGELLMDPLRAAAAKHALAPALRGVEIRASKLGADAEVRGAVLLALQHSETYYRVVFRA